MVQLMDLISRKSHGMAIGTLPCHCEPIAKLTNLFIGFPWVCSWFTHGNYMRRHLLIPPDFSMDNSWRYTMDFPWVFAHMNYSWFNHGNYTCHRLSILHDFSMDNWWRYTMEFPWGVHIVNPWILHGSYMDCCPWLFHEFSMVNSYGQKPMEKPWNLCNEPHTSWWLITKDSLDFLWYNSWILFHGKVMVWLLAFYLATANPLES